MTALSRDRNRTAVTAIEHKLARVRELLDAVGDVVWESLRDSPEDIFAPLARDPRSDWWLSRVADLDIDFPQAAVIGGEVYYHLRSTLEHLVWALVKANHHKPIDKVSGNTFPIFTTQPADFVGSTARKQLRGVRRDAVRIIESFQPYRTRSMNLKVIDTFAKVDRHRSLLTSVLIATQPHQLRALYTIHPPNSLVQFQRLLRPGQRLSPGVRLARFRVKPGIVPGVFFNGTLRLEVSITDGATDVDGDVEGSVAEVTRLFEALKPYLHT